jgi:hypothetical protein
LTGQPKFARVVHAGVLICQLAALVALVARWETLRGLPLDDAWIHQVVARTFARTGTLGYAPGHYGAAATSYLWATLLAGNYRFLHANPGIFTFVLNALAYVAAGQCFAALLLRARPESEDEATWALISGGVAAIAGTAGNFVWFAVSGMEASLLATLSLAAILLLERPIAAGVCAGALALLRPEAALLGPLLALRSRHRIRLLAPWAAAVAIYVGSNFIATGSPLPMTLGGRHWLYFGELGGAARRLQFAIDWCNRLQKYTLGSSIDALLVLSIALAAFGVWQLWRTRNWPLQLLLLWAALHILTFAILLPSTGHGGRYQPLVPLLFLGAAAFGAVTLARMALRGRASALAMAPFALATIFSIHDWRPVHAMAVDHIRRTEIGMGERVNQLPAAARVASYDIGGIGFAATRPVLDLGALSDAHTAQMLRERRAWQWLRDEHVDYVILPSWYSDDLPHSSNFGYRLGLFDNPALELTRVYELQTPEEIWLPVIVATWNASPRQVLYQVRYTGVEGPNLPDRLGRAPKIVDPDGLLSWQGSATVERGLAVLAGADVHVGLALNGQPQSEEWQIRIADFGVAVSAPIDIPPESARQAVADAVLPYIAGKAWDDAAIESLHAIARVVRQHRDPRFLPFLPTHGPPPHGATRTGRSLRSQMRTVPSRATRR